MHLDKQVQNEKSGFEFEKLKDFLFNMIVASNNLLRIYKENKIFYEALFNNREKLDDFIMKLREQGRLGDFYLSQLEIFNNIQSDSNLNDLTDNFKKLGNLYSNSLDLTIANMNQSSGEKCIAQSRYNYEQVCDVVLTIKQRLLNSLSNMHEVRYHNNVQAEIKNRLQSYFDRLKDYYDYLIKSLLVLNGGGTTAILAVINTMKAKSEMFLVAKTSLISFASGLLSTLLILLFTLFSIAYTNTPFVKAVIKHSKQMITTTVLEENLIKTEQRKNCLGVILYILVLIPAVAFVYGLINGFQLI